MSLVLKRRKIEMGKVGFNKNNNYTSDKYSLSVVVQII